MSIKANAVYKESQFLFFNFYLYNSLVLMDSMKMMEKLEEMAFRNIKTLYFFYRKENAN